MTERESGVVRRVLSNVAGQVADHLRGDRFLTFLHGKIGRLGAPHNPVQVLNDDGTIIGSGIVTKTDVPRGTLTIELRRGEKITVRGRRVI